MIVMIALVFIVLGLNDFPQLIKQKKWYEVSVLAGLYVFVFALAALMTFHVTLPSPAKGAQHLIVDVLHLGYPQK